MTNDLRPMANGLDVGKKNLQECLYQQQQQQSRNLQHHAAIVSTPHKSLSTPVAGKHYKLESPWVQE